MPAAYSAVFAEMAPIQRDARLMPPRADSAFALAAVREKSTENAKANTFLTQRRKVSKTQSDKRNTNPHPDPPPQAMEGKTEHFEVQQINST